MSSAEVVCCMQMLTSMTDFGMQTNSVDPDQTAPSSLSSVHIVCYRDVLNGLTDETADDI